MSDVEKLLEKFRPGGQPCRYEPLPYLFHDLARSLSTVLGPDYACMTVRDEALALCLRKLLEARDAAYACADAVVELQFPGRVGLVSPSEGLEDD